MSDNRESEIRVLRIGADSASRILAYALAKHLLNTGIANQPLQWRLMKKHYVCCYVTSSGFFSRWKKDLRLEPGPATELWRPAEIPEAVWDCAIQKFTYTGLEENLHRHLLPLLGDAKSLVPYDQLVAITERVFLDEGILNCPVRELGAEAFYFNEQRLLVKCQRDKLAAEENSPGTYKRIPWFTPLLDLGIWNKAVTCFTEGSTLRQCIDIYFQTKIYSRAVSYSYLQRLVTKIEAPEYERIPENEDEKTFDRIRVTVNLSYTLHPESGELRKAVMEHRKEIDALVIQVIENDRSFKRYGIPVNALKLGALTLFNHALEYIFELKEAQAD